MNEILDGAAFGFCPVFAIQGYFSYFCAIIDI